MKYCFARIASLILGIFSVCIAADLAGADTVVQFTINGTMDGLYGPLNSFQIQLFDSQFNNPTANTVTNFLLYVNNHRYDNSIVHRSVPGFVIQGGGYTNQLATIPDYGTIVNEASPARSNTRATIAMAKGEDPDSATSQLFINVADKLSLDDPSNCGGYTVFGRVVGEGMSLVDAINHLPIPNPPILPDPFTELPLYSSEPPYYYSDLVTVTTATVVPTIEWKGGSTNNWGVAGNWTPGVSAPNGAGVNVVIGSQNAAYNVVDMVSGGRTVGNLYFNSNVATTIQSTGQYSLTLDNGANASVVNVLGDQTITAPLILNSNTIFSGNGTLTLSGGISGDRDMNVLEGSIIAGNIRTNTLKIDAGAKVTIQPLAGGPLGGGIIPVPEPSTFAMLVYCSLGVFSPLFLRRIKRFLTA